MTSGLHLSELPARLRAVAAAGALQANPKIWIQGLALGKYPGLLGCAPLLCSWVYGTSWMNPFEDCAPLGLCCACTGERDLIGSEPQGMFQEALSANSVLSKLEL